MRRRRPRGACAWLSTYRDEELSTGALRMCGIVGLFCKSPELEPRLGEYLSAMLVQMSDRGPDSAGVALYREPAPAGCSKLTLYSTDECFDWSGIGGGGCGGPARPPPLGLDGGAGEAEGLL